MRLSVPFLQALDREESQVKRVMSPDASHAVSLPAWCDVL